VKSFATHDKGATVATTKRTSVKAPTKKRVATIKKTTAAKKAAKKTGARKRAPSTTESVDDADDVEATEVTDVRAASPRDPEDTGAALDLRPGARRAVFFDVENTSRAEDVERVLHHLAIDFAHGPLEFHAVGNWRVIGHEPARQLAAHGAALVHSAPSTGVRDWSDLRIAVAAGVWLAGAMPGDVIEIVSDDQAFDAVGDVAASRGVVFRRLSYRSLAGIRGGERRPVREAPSESRAPRRRRRGGRRNGWRRPDGSGTSESAAEAPRASAADEHVETAPVDEVVHVVQDLVAGSPAGVTLDEVAAALRERGFRRPAGSARLITRLKLIKDIEVGRDGRIRVAGSADVVEGDGSSDAEAEPGAEQPTGSPRRRRRRRRRPRGSATAADEAPAS
jgi:hypothetical protein